MQAAQVAPKDPDLRKKLAECEREVKRQRFEDALTTPVSNLLVPSILLFRTPPDVISILSQSCAAPSLPSTNPLTCMTHHTNLPNSCLLLLRNLVILRN